MNRQELDRRHAETLQILDRLGVRHSCITAAQIVGDERVGLGKALDVRLVHDRAMPGRSRAPILSPVEERVDDDALGHERRAVEIVARGFRRHEVIREDRLVPVPRPVDRLRVRIEQQLGWVAPRALFRRPRSVHPEAVALSGLHIRQVTVPAQCRALGQVEPCFGALFVKETQLDAFGSFGKHREIGANPVKRRAERRVMPRPGPHRAEMVAQSGHGSGLRAQG